ncbi:chaperonin 10-like protein [Clohesyomyces aquaticus]|uniref:Chaperonin 10-like protein n=1 Tax=Clohesyomyces aquaticus TaxID=1231657 RepID=A0A1Y1ZTN3_9PLEO|nr:chaperonin 10-like protein [Clohesyomyces aquaticus]
MPASAADKTPDLAPSTQKIRASVLHGANDLRIESRTLSPPGPTDVQVAILATGLCGSDLHYYRHYRNGDILVQEPLSLGHESAGVVVDVGSSVTRLNVGDKVALEVGLPCEQCERCNEGRYNICKGMNFRSSAKAFPHAQGTLQDRVNHPERWCYKLPDSMSLALGALLEPLSVAIHALSRASIPPPSRGARPPTILVFGAGAVGLLVAAYARLSHPSATILIADIDAGRVNFALSHHFAHLGYTVPIPPKTPSPPSIEDSLSKARETASSIAAVKRSTDEEVGEVDYVFECTGVPSCLQTAIYATRPGGRIMLIGMGSPIQTLPISAAALREVDLVGVFRYRDTYPRGIEILGKCMEEKGDGVPDFEALVTHRYKGLEKVEDAFEMAGRTVDGQGGLVIKVLVEMDGGVEGAKL